MGQIAHALLTRPPLKHPKVSSLDLHVLGTPPAFVLSQDQTLMFNPSQFISISLNTLRCLSQKSDCLLLALAQALALAVFASCSCLSVFTISFSRIACRSRSLATTFDSIAKGYSKVKLFFRIIFKFFLPIIYTKIMTASENFLRLTVRKVESFSEILFEAISA